MAFGRKRKAIREDKEAVEAVVSKDKAYQKLQDTLNTQLALEKNANIREEIKQCFNEALASTREKDTKNKALENERYLEELEEQYQQAVALGAATDNSGISYSHLWDMEQGLYIVPGGYAQMPGPDNDVPKHNLGAYTVYIQSLFNDFNSKDSAVSVERGADQIEGYMVFFLKKLRSAIENGKALSAITCINIIRYILKVGYRFEAHFDEASRQKSLEKKKEFLTETALQLVAAVDYYYDLIDEYRRTEKRYDKDWTEIHRLQREYNQNCPADDKNKIERLGIDKANQVLRWDDPSRAFLNQLLEIRQHLTPVYLESLGLETMAGQMIVLMGSIDEMIEECERVMNASGNSFDENAFYKVMTELRDKKLRIIDRAQDMIIENVRFQNETESLVKAAADNIEYLHTGASNIQALSRFEETERKQENLRKRQLEQLQKYKDHLQENNRKKQEMLLQRQQILSDINEEEEREAVLAEELRNQEQENEALQNTVAEEREVLIEGAE